MIEKNNSRSENLRDSQNGIDKHLGYKRSNQTNYNKCSFASQNKPLRVSKRQHCFICGKPDWCCFTVDDFGQPELALCMRIATGSVKTASNGSYVHVLNEIQPISYEVRQNCVKQPKAEIERLNAVYTKLLKRLNLESSHAQNLLERGLSDDTIARNLYASVPSKEIGDKIAQKLARKFDLTGVAGFYKDKRGLWRLATGYWFQDESEKWNWNQYSGIFVPYRNHKGFIIGLQIRLDTPIEKITDEIENEDTKDEKPRRYIWLSSANKLKGASSGTPLHFVSPDLVRQTKAVLITEGALKADVIADLCPEVSVIAIAGVQAVNALDLTEIVSSLFPDIERVTFAFDMDAMTNDKVNDALTKMENAFQQIGNLEVTTFSWDATLGKGFDDYLLQEIRGGK